MSPAHRIINKLLIIVNCAARGGAEVPRRGLPTIIAVPVRLPIVEAGVG